jgi:dye decolorizing peroxidase
MTAPSRRRFLAAGGVGLGGAALGATGAALATRQSPPSGSTASTASVVATGNQELAVYGRYQPGIIAPAQSQARLAAFDLTDTANRAAVARLMRAWTQIAAQACAGRPLAEGDDAMAYGRGPASLSVTVGFGSSLLRKLGLHDLIPDALAPIPAFPGDHLDPARSDGDVGVLVAGNDGLVVLHALRALQRAATGTARARWQMSGFSDAPGVMPIPTSTPRNLMGQLDGTDNPTPTQADFAEKIFVPADATPAWMRGGSYLVVRRIRMLLDTWDTLDTATQEAVVGRRKTTGAPLSGGTEQTPPDYTRQRADGGLAIPADAHIRLANPTTNQGATILRRGFSYHDGLRPDGTPDAGLLFLAFQADPRIGFIPIQQRLAEADALSTFITHETNALFAIPPGAQPSNYLAQDLFDA